MYSGHFKGGGPKLIFVGPIDFEILLVGGRYTQG